MRSFWANRWNIADIFFIYTPFLSDSPTGQTFHDIFTLNGSNDADSLKGVPFWLSLILQPILAIKLPQNPNFWGVNRDFPAKRVKYWNVHIINRGFAMAEWPRDALVSRNSRTTKHPIWKLEFQAYRVALFAFLPREAMLSAVFAVVVCLCVCLCVCYTPVLYQNGYT